MTAIFNKKTVQILFLALMGSVVACSEATNSGRASTEDSGVKLAYILEKTATPTKWDPDGAEVDNFKHCVQWSAGNEATAQATYQLHVDEIKFDLETVADAKANNYEVSTPPVQTKSASLIGACPSGAIAKCDKGNVVEHYYTDAEWVLAGFEKSCGYSGSDVWTKTQ